MELFGRLGIAICVIALAVYTVSGHSLAKRNAIQLCAFMQHYTGISCLAYNNYGCYCRKDQVAVTPRDTVDRCCKSHRACYGMVENRGYCLFNDLHVPYAASCSGTECSCSSEQWTCPYKVCECDLTFAKCLAIATYHEKYARYDTRKCV